AEVSIQGHGLRTGDRGYGQRKLVDTPERVEEEIDRQEGVVHTTVPHLVAALAEVGRFIRSLGAEVDQEALVDGATSAPEAEWFGQFAARASKRAAVELDGFLHATAD